MAFNFINIAMLAGLVTVSLPVLAHLLSKRRYDVVQWGAMQFLQLGHKTRRRIRLQDLVLLLLRMLALAALAIALARPYGQGGLFNQLGDSVSRDIVFIIDGSGSMSLDLKGKTPHARSIDWIHQALEELNPGDTVSLIDARSQNRKILNPPTASFSNVRQELNELPAPVGPSHLTEAVMDGLRILATTSNASRELIVLTDGQALPWKLDEELRLQRIDDARQQPEITPILAVVDLSQGAQDRTNFSVGNIELARPLTVPGFPLRFKATIRQSGGVPQTVPVHLTVNGQTAHDAQRVVNLLPDGEAVVEFEHTFPEKGYYRLGIHVEEDLLPQDNAVEAIVVVEDGLPVLLVDGDPNVDETKSETFFLQAAFNSSGQDTAWVNAKAIPTGDLDSQNLKNHQVVFLCNVSDISAEQRLQLIDFVFTGGSVVFAPGQEVNATHWNNFKYDQSDLFLPAKLLSIQSESNAESVAVMIDSLSLKDSWLERFRKEEGVDFWQTRFSHWWEVEVNTLARDDDSSEASQAQRPTVHGQLTNGHPFLLSRRLGKGTVIQLTTPLDADWSTFPARNDFVPVVHELVFHLAELITQQNVEVGMPIQVVLKEDERPRDFIVNGPGVKDAVPEFAVDSSRSLAAFRETSIPGRYYFEKRVDAVSAPIPFIVTDDRSESDLTPLDDVGWSILKTDDRFQKLDSMQELTDQVQSTNTRVEFGWFLLLVLLGMLVCEVALTRKMLHSGHDELIQEAQEE